MSEISITKSQYKKPFDLVVVGGGLAGSEVAWQCLRAGYRVCMYEMRPVKMTAAHQSGDLAELVCSNSLKSENPQSAPGQLKWEMKAMDSLILAAAEKARVPAGQSLAVERKQFSSFVQSSLESFEGFELRKAEFTSELLDSELADYFVLATGPLTSEPIAEFLSEASGSEKRLFFYDAIAPVLATESLDMDVLFKASRYDESGEGDYLNIPLDKDAYENFIDQVIAAEKMPLHEFENTPFFESCLPIEVMIERGRDTLRFGPMKPVGLRDPKTGKWPYAAIQLRQENTQATAYSMVGFQTKMKWPEQARVFRSLPGMAEAEFYRFGSIHRNTFVHGPKILQSDFSLKAKENVFLAGQLTGVEGYSESAAQGLLCGRAIISRLKRQAFFLPPKTSVLGSLGNYVLEGGLGDYQPMNANFGLLPALDLKKKVRKDERKRLHCERARQDFSVFLDP